MNLKKKRSKKRKINYKSSFYTKYLCQYHIIWCSKFRYPVLKNETRDKLIEIIKDIADRYNYEIIEYEVMPDHIHLFIGAKPTVAPIDIVRTIKSISAIKMFKAFPKLKQFYSKCGSLWSVGKFISTIGKVSENTIKKYIQEQTNGKET